MERSVLATLKTKAHPMTEITNSPNTLTLELSFNPRGELVVHLPATQTFKPGNTTLRTGFVEEELRNILNIESKIRRHEAEFYGEPETSQLARDLRAGRIAQRNIIRNSSAVLELDLDL